MARRPGEITRTSPCSPPTSRSSTAAPRSISAARAQHAALGRVRGADQSARQSPYPKRWSRGVHQSHHLRHRLTSGTAADLYKVCFNDIIGGNNANGFGSGFTAVKGYDLCTGLGTPQVGLIFQIASPTPLTPNQPLALIRFVIQTGDDDAGGGEHGSEQTADVFFLDGTSHTFVLRTKSEPHWHKGSTHTVDFQIPTNISQPLTPSHGLAGVRINLVQSNPDIAADNWDIATLAVSLFDPALRSDDIGLPVEPDRHGQVTRRQHGPGPAEQESRQQRRRTELPRLSHRPHLRLPVKGPGDGDRLVVSNGCNVGEASDEQACRERASALDRVNPSVTCPPRFKFERSLIAWLDQADDGPRRAGIGSTSQRSF